MADAMVHALTKRRTTRGLALAVTAALSVGAVLTASPADAVTEGPTRLVSTAPDGLPGDSDSFQPVVSGNGRYVAFESDSALVAGIPSGQRQVYRRDLATGAIKVVSVNSANTAGDLGSSHASISDDGRYVAFVSDATNLVANDTNAAPDAFVRDVTSGVTSRVSVSSTGEEAAAGVSDGGIFLSANGRYVAFDSESTNLVPGAAVVAGAVYVRDLVAHKTKLGSANSAGVAANDASEISPGGALSADGHYLVFSSIASNVVSGDTNARFDAFVRDLTTGVTRRISVGASGAQFGEHSTDAVISADGCVVSFSLNNVAVYVRRRHSGTNLGTLPAGSNGVVLSANGRRVAYYARASDQTDQSYVRDLSGGAPIRVTAPAGGGTGGGTGGGGGYLGDLSSDGRTVTFFSNAGDLLPGGSSTTFQVYVRALAG